MTKQHLHTSYVGVVPHEVNRKAVAEGVGVHRRTGKGPVLPDNVVQLPALQREQFGPVS